MQRNAGRIRNLPAFSNTLLNILARLMNPKSNSRLPITPIHIDVMRRYSGTCHSDILLSEAMSVPR